MHGECGGDYVCVHVGGCGVGCVQSVECICGVWGVRGGGGVRGTFMRTGPSGGGQSEQTPGVGESAGGLGS